MPWILHLLLFVAFFLCLYTEVKGSFYQIFVLLPDNPRCNCRNLGTQKSKIFVLRRNNSHKELLLWKGMLGLHRTYSLFILKIRISYFILNKVIQKNESLWKCLFFTLLHILYNKVLWVFCSVLSHYHNHSQLCKKSIIKKAMATL